MSAPANPPAFPREDYQADDAPGQRGMTLRDWFAGQALAGVIANPSTPDQMIGLGYKGSKDTLAAYAFAAADAMLAERAKS